jgi:predicted nuclease with RNAse H fold
MLTVGIDLAAQPEDTAAFEVQWHDTHAEIVSWHNPVNDEQILTLIAKADKVGIDVPLGWPTEFVRAVYRHLSANSNWPKVSMRRFRLRATDRYVADTIRMSPLSVSTDRIGIPAARAASLLSTIQSDRDQDRTGNGRVVEVYPAAALKVWGFRFQGYKGRDGRDIRDELVTAWAQRTEAWGRWTDEALAAAREDDNLFDAFVAATVARCAALNLTSPIPSSLKRRARFEGWIAVPLADSLINLFPAMKMET